MSGAEQGAAIPSAASMPPPSAGASTVSSNYSGRGGGQRGGGPGRGRGRGRPGRPPGKAKRRGPGRPPNSERQGPPAGRTSEVRRGPGRPPGKRKKVPPPLDTFAPDKPKRKYTKRKDDSIGKDGDDSPMAVESIEQFKASPPRSTKSGYETDPETALDVSEGKVSTVHWDPAEGSKIGWKIRVSDDKASDWKEGRVV